MWGVKINGCLRRDSVVPDDLVLLVKLQREARVQRSQAAHMGHSVERTGRFGSGRLCMGGSSVVSWWSSCPLEKKRAVRVTGTALTRHPSFAASAGTRLRAIVSCVRVLSLGVRCAATVGPPSPQESGTHKLSWPRQIRGSYSIHSPPWQVRQASTLQPKFRRRGCTGNEGPAAPPFPRSW